MSTHTAQLVKHLLADLGLDSIPERMPARICRDKFTREYLAYNIVRKLEPFSEKSEVPLDVLRRSLTTFAEAEWNCLVVNQHGRYYSIIDPDEKARFTEASRLADLWISRTLTDYWPRWEHQDYTSGASRNLPRSESLRVMKENGGTTLRKLSATSSACAYTSMNERPWHSRDIEIVEDSRFDFVQKTADTVRFMAMEAEYNMLGQRCLGDCIRAALYDVGINLNDQRPNQQLAHLGSIFRTRATIDLSSASDCAALRHLNRLPKRFREWCVDLRSPKTSVVGGKYEHVLQKIATMGNGFIFELQSLLFASFAHAITSVYGGRECDIAVYGDDIVVSTTVAEPLMRFLEWNGFIPNVKKTYWDEDEPFRESCGKHWFAGHDVTPFYVKEPIGTLPTIFRAYNGLKYWTQRTGIALPSATHYLVGLIAKEDRMIVPTSWAVTSGLHWPCAGASFPVSKFRKDWQRCVTTQRCLVPPEDDVTERICDHYRLAWWFFEPPAPLIDVSLYPKGGPRARARSILRNTSVLLGEPREAMRVVRGTSTETSEWSWVHREVHLGDTT